MKKVKIKMLPALEKAEASCSADMRFQRTASTAAVRTQRRNERSGLSASLLICSCWEHPNPYLTREVSNMVRTIDEYNAKDIQNSIDRKNLEIQMLQAQINPHFLFNTLNSIKWIAVLSRVPTVADSLAALAGLLKNTIVNKGEQIPLREELENVRNYALIQSLRYTERFQME